LNTAIKVQEIYLKRIDETNEKIFYINNTMNANIINSINEENKLTSIKISSHEQKLEEIRNQFSGIDTALYDLKTKIGIHRLNFRFNI
jgi:hypothetical protein